MPLAARKSVAIFAGIVTDHLRPRAAGCSLTVAREHGVRPQPWLGNNDLGSGFGADKFIERRSPASPKERLCPGGTLGAAPPDVSQDHTGLHGGTGRTASATHQRCVVPWPPTQG